MADRNSLMSDTDPARLAAAIEAIRACRLCVERPDGPPLPHEPRPVLRVSATARLLVAGQAPGARVHRSGVPFADPSGDRLRAWMGVDEATFYDAARVAVVPMGFCFPGLDASGSDLPPRRECRKRWHDELFAALGGFEVVLAIGRYAQDYHLARLGHAMPNGASVAETVARWREFADARPRIFPLPHPSWRNSGWLKRHPWFEAELLPELRREVGRVLHGARQ
jgi:uracil-DNA glycosylase